MDKREIAQAKKLLDDRCDRFSIAGTDDGKLCLTAYFAADGGQKIFYNLDDVIDFLREMSR